jgi:AAA domain
MAFQAPDSQSGSGQHIRRLLIHITVCASLDRDFAGHKCKNPGPFVYVAAEDAAGVEKRLVGYCMAHGISQADVPVAIIRVAPNLGTVDGDAISMGEAIDAELTAKGYGNPSGIIVDTLNQTLGDADENGPGMQAFMANANLLATAFTCPVFAANHVGHAEKDRERGGSQIKGNADTRLQVERTNHDPVIVNGVKTFETLMHVRKVKNGEDGFSFKATLRQFVLGKDSDGDDVTTLVVDRVERLDGESKPKKAGRHSPKLDARRDGFVEAYHHLSNDVEPVWGPDRRAKVRKVPVGAIQEYMRCAGLLDDDISGKRFSDLKLEMIAPKTGRFIERDGMVWPLNPEGPFEFTAKDKN